MHGRMEPTDPTSSLTPALADDWVLVEARRPSGRREDGIHIPDASLFDRVAGCPG